MKAYISTSFSSISIQRIASELENHCFENTEIVPTVEEADMVVFYVVGRRDHITAATESLLRKGKKYAIVQIALRSTRNPNTADWQNIWQKASLVWSYYDLPALQKEDGSSFKFNFLHAPLGVDASTFFYKPLEREYISQTNGTSTKAECIYETFDAAGKVGKKVAHFGSSLEFRRNVDYFGTISDYELNNLHNRCFYISALRRMDGFEQAAPEGIICGAKPIVFDTPNYRQWFDEFAEFIPERPYGKVVADLVKLFTREYVPLTQEKIELAKALFNWKTIIETFWSMCD